MKLPIFASQTPEIPPDKNSGKWEIYRYDFNQYYLADTPKVSLLAVLTNETDKASRVLLTDQVSLVTKWLEKNWPAVKSLDELANIVEAPIFSFGKCWKLQPVKIPKPWGQEIWYTGIEQRGQSQVTDGRYSIPLPWLLSLGEEQLLAPGCQQPNLLKILDPLVDEAYGDLYFELHEEKQEVYVVTAVSSLAWPSGQGAIRYGFDQKKRAAYGRDQAFREAYAEAVKNYESIRRNIDSYLDNFRQQEGIALNAPVAVETLKCWQKKLPDDLVNEEAAARKQMDSFTHMLSLDIGDVVKVACLTPHALQHGVRTVEFQTPVYERKILNFTQKVLTQSHWDTDDAIAMMALESGQTEQLVEIRKNKNFILEQVVIFDDFQVFRLTLNADAIFSLTLGDHYKVIMVVSGRLWAGEQLVCSEEAVLAPRTVAKLQLKAGSGEQVVCLISVPIVKE